MDVTNGATSVFQKEVDRLKTLMAGTKPWDLALAEEYCRKWAHQQYENFTVVSWLLPTAFRQDFYNIYSYCRWSDNLADEIDDTSTSLHLLAEWEQELLLCWDGEPRHPILRALQATVRRHALRPKPFRDLLSAFRQDRVVLRYSDEESLLDYCRRSANPVGRILLQLAKADEEENLELSDSICTGLQIANFCQDMARDAALGRIYAPKTLWAKHNVTEAELLAGIANPKLTRLLTEWVLETWPYFEQGRPLVERVPAWLATDVALFIGGGQAILRAIEKQNCDVWTRRPIVSKWTKLGLLGKAILRRSRGGKRSRMGGDARHPTPPHVEEVP